MQVRILLFGAEAAALGREEVTVEVPESRSPADCATLRDRLAAEHPALAPYLRASRFAINSEFARPDQPIRPGDEVALIGMVSGG